VLDAIGGGAHRVSEIAARLGRPATSMARPLDRLVAMGLVRREVPFGESEKRTRRSLYVIADPFFRLWFGIVAPHRAMLAAGSAPARRALLRDRWPALAAQAWEELCRHRLPRLGVVTRAGELGPWGPASRWWHGNAPEWDVMARSLDGRSLLLGEAKWSPRPVSGRAFERAAAELEARPAPPDATTDSEIVVRALFVPELDRRAAAIASRRPGVLVITAGDLLA
jgi:hypothetical protein